jgi:hypothetical protein
MLSPILLLLAAPGRSINVSFLPQREVFCEFVEAAATACSRDVVYRQMAFSAGIYKTL